MQYQYAPEYLRQRRTELAVAGDDLVTMLCENTVKRARAAKFSYLEFGPYWWAVKRTLDANGFSLGTSANEYEANRFAIVGEGGSVDHELTLIAAWECADEIREGYFYGSRDFYLSDDETFTLFDPDMERPSVRGAA